MFTELCRMFECFDNEFLYAKDSIIRFFSIQNRMIYLMSR